MEHCCQGAASIEVEVQRMFWSKKDKSCNTMLSSLPMAYYYTLTNSNTYLCL